MKVYICGAGPGNPELLTIRAKEVIENANAIVYDNLVSPNIINLARFDAELIFAGKRAGKHYMKQSEINDLLVKLASKYQNIVRLKGGDPFVFGRGGEEADYLYKHNIPFEIVPGISSAISACEYSGIALTHRDFSSSFSVYTAHRRDDNHKYSDYGKIDNNGDSKVFLMSLENLDNLCKKLINDGFDPNTGCAVIEKASTPFQRCCFGNLENISEKVKSENISYPALTVVGNATLEKNIRPWYNRYGKNPPKILITGSRNYCLKLSSVLEKNNLPSECISLIYTKVKNFEKLEDFKDYDYLVLTSANGVDTFFEILKENKIDLRKISHMKFAVIGEGTKERLENYGFSADIIPQDYTGKSLGKKLVSICSDNEKILIFRAENGSPDLTNSLEKGRKKYKLFPIYKTEIAENRQEILNRIANRSDYIILSSSSAVAGFSKLYNGENKNFKIVSIGPVTSKACIEYGINPDITAKIHSCEGIAESIVEDIKNVFHSNRP